MTLLFQFDKNSLDDLSVTGEGLVLLDVVKEMAQVCMRALAAPISHLITCTLND